ncbi:DNA-binding transcriptional regulator, GntR family [Streptomyces zhaozhouensis]|uniref:DNA-binding transcriptional regulator, GntR family n=1 Tax=Streptomyces zhaozhouensis TaxID=1300267 RepID=A0A286DU11_9ACTN|nr:GntR family transcriptional regulator [Streptomyces zhaozhouensis]SOD62131.1 DNA-binding transcriptional regulator, GntR family [Streptomyces zhaozhouensis]
MALPPQSGADVPPYQVLRDEIVGGALPPGAPLLETALAARLGVGRAPVREAIQRLEWDGLVVRGSRSPEVRTLTATEVVEIYQARIALESEAAASAAAHRSALDLARLRHVHDEAGRSEDPDEIRALHGRWHEVLRRACHNRTITDVLDRLALQLALYDSADMSRNPNLDSSDDEHAEILDAIAEGDQDRARTLLRTHLERTRDVRIAALVREETTAG